MVEGDVVAQVPTTQRLFAMTSVSGVFDVSEVLSPFRRMGVTNTMPHNQSTLYTAEQPALFLLEAPGGTCLWLWQGWLPQDQGDGDSGTTGSSEVRWHAERRAAMGTVLEYRQAKHGTPPPPVKLCWAGHEPQVFINYFSSWTARQDVAAFNQQSVGEDNLEVVYNQLSRKEYTWEELKKSPPGVDPAKIHTYLSEHEFQEKFDI